MRTGGNYYALQKKEQGINRRDVLRNKGRRVSFAGHPAAKANLNRPASGPSQLDRVAIRS